MKLFIKLKNYSRAIWENNLKIVEQHNLQADLGVYTYWLGMNEYADLVKFDLIQCVANLFFNYRLLMNL